MGRVYLSEFVDRKYYIEKSNKVKQDKEWLEEKLYKPIQLKRAEDKVCELLSELFCTVEKAREAFKLREVLNALTFEKDIPGTRDPNERGDIFYWIFEGVKDLIKQSGHVRGCREKAHLLFSFWGFSVTESAIRSNKKKGLQDRGGKVRGKK